MSLERQIERRKIRNDSAANRHCIIAEKVLNECFLARCIPVRIELVRETICQVPVEHQTVLCPAADPESPLETSAFATVVEATPGNGSILVTGLVHSTIRYAPKHCSHRQVALLTAAPFTCCAIVPKLTPDSICRVSVDLECQTNQLLQSGRALHFAGCVKVTIHVPVTESSSGDEELQSPRNRQQ